MKTQISNDSFRPEKRYSGVYQQQGRMITDADWNELVEIVKQRLADVLGDVVGSGAPRNGPLEFTEDKTIKPGRVYVDGIAAELPGGGEIQYDDQPDFPAAGDLPPAGDYVVYADVWERTVVSLEDPLIRDPALHGADTCTRTQTMVQVKWCRPDEWDFVEFFPAGKGNAKLSEVRLREPGDAENSGSVDPCAEEIHLEPPIGNYLFRLEVHDVELDEEQRPAKLTLKWSSENGAEHHPQIHAPDEFKSGGYSYEFYDQDMEQQLGIHHRDFDRPRGPILPEFPPSAPRLPFVRRWDGYCILEWTDGAWTVLPDGFSDVGGQASSASVDGTHLALRLRSLELRLQLLAAAGVRKAFVVGDYWLTVVRDTSATNEPVRPLSQEPLGVNHHYLKLAEVEDGARRAPADGAPPRHLRFPPLTDLEARDSEYHPTATSDSWDKLLRLLARGDSRLPADVQDAIDKLVFRLATLIDMANGQQAWVTVGENGQFATLAEAFAALDKRDSITICLLPGEHLVREKNDLTVPSDGPGCVSITIFGVGGSRVQLHNNLSLRAQRIALLDVAIEVHGETRGLELFAEEVIAERAVFEHYLDAALHPWSAVAHASRFGRGSAVAADDKGRVVVVGDYAGRLDLGDKHVTTGTDLRHRHIFTGQLSGESGAVLWLQSSTGEGEATFTGFSLDLQGNLVIGGELQGKVLLPPNAGLSSDNRSGYVARFQAENGRHEWHRVFRSTDSVQIKGVAAKSRTSVAAVADLTGTLQLGQLDPLTTPLETWQGIIAKLRASDGRPLWATKIAKDDRSEMNAVAIDRRDDVWVAEIQFSRQGADFLGIYTLAGTDGVFKGGKMFPIEGSKSHVEVRQLVIDGSDDVIVMGNFQGTLKIPDLELDLRSHGNDRHDVFVMKLRGDDRTLKWVKHFASPGEDFAYGLEINAERDLLIAGAYEEELDLGGDRLTGSSDRKMFLGKLKRTNGEHIWSRDFPSTGRSSGLAVAATSANSAAVVGDFEGMIDLGTGPISAATDKERSVARFIGNVRFADPRPLVHVRRRTWLTFSRSHVHWLGNQMRTVWQPRIHAPTNPTHLLAIADEKIGGTIRDNRIEGILSLLFDAKRQLLIVPDGAIMLVDIDGAPGTLEFVIAGESVVVSGNMLARFETGVEPPDAIALDRSLVKRVAGYEAVVIADNVLQTDYSSIICRSLTMSGNRFPEAKSDVVAAFVLANQAVFVGNQAAIVEPAPSKGVIHVVAGEWEKAANLINLEYLLSGR